MPSGLISISKGSNGASRISAASFAKGATDKPWNELVQSMCDGSSSCSFIGTSNKPDARVADVGASEYDAGEGDRGPPAAAVVVAGLGAASALWE
jgi:hypothetical protein